MTKEDAAKLLSNPIYFSKVKQLAREKFLQDKRVQMALDPYGAIDLSPNPKQLAFVNAILDPSIMTAIHLGGIGSGKTTSGTVGMLSYGYRYPNSRFVVGRLNAKDLYESTYLAVGDILGRLFSIPITSITQLSDFPEIGLWSPQKNTLTLVDGPTIFFRHFQEAGQLGSTEYDLAYIEEGWEIPDDLAEGVAGVIPMLQGRIRKQTPPRKGLALLPSSYKMVITSMAKGKSWVWAMAFGDPDNPERPKALNSFTVESTYRDNIDNLAKSYIEQLESYPEFIRQRLVDGSHESFEGELFTIHQDNIISPFIIPRDWPVLGSHDWGISSGGWVYLARVCGDYQTQSVLLHDGDLVLVDEEQVANLTISEQAEKFREKESIYRIVRSIVDPSAQSRTHSGDKFVRITDLFQQEGIILEAGSRDLNAGLMSIHDHLEHRKLHLFSTCQGIITDLRTITIKNQPSKHFAAALRYGLLANPEYMKPLTHTPRIASRMARQTAQQIDSMKKEKVTGVLVPSIYHRGRM